MKIFKTAEKAFEYYYRYISNHGILFDGTKTIFNEGFYIANTQNNIITTKWRNWKLEYANIEWEWYLSGNNSVAKIKKHAKLWDKMHDGDNIVNSNYGFQWNRNNQLKHVIKLLKKKLDSRQAFITIHDGKEIAKYRYDCPCTLSIGFNIINNKLNIVVLMRSNDLWFGFCNDQYCFSKLQKMVADSLKIKTGSYFHYVTNFHIYEKHLNKNKNVKKQINKY